MVRVLSSYEATSVTFPKPLVSIVVPHFNSNFYEKTFPSSIMQTRYSNFELIIVDDLSTDSSLEKIREIYGNDGRIRIVRNLSRMGPAATRNKGIQLARGDFVAFIETDMEVDPSWITEVIELFKVAQSDVGAIQCKVIDINNRKVMQAYGIKIIPQTGCVVSIGMGEPPERYNTIDDVCSGAVGLIVKRPVLEAVRGFDESLVHNIDDVDLAWRIWISGKRIVTCPNAIVYHWTGKPKAMRAKALSSFSSEFHFNKLPFVLVKNYELRNILRYLPTCFLFLLARCTSNLLRGDPTTAKAFAKAMTWGLANLNQIIVNRAEVQQSRQFSDRFLFARIFAEGNLILHILRNLQIKRLVERGMFSQKPLGFS